MAGCFRKADVPGNYIGKYLSGEMLADFLGYLGGEIGSAVKHGQRHAEDLQPGIHFPFHHPQSGHQIAETFQCVIFTLYGNQNTIRGAETVEGQQFQRRRAVDENDIIIGFCAEQYFFQLPFPVVCVDQFHSGTGQVGCGRQYVAVFGMDDGIFQRNIIDGDIIDGIFDFAFVHTQTRCGICLGVKVAEQDVQSQIMEGSCQIDCGCGFAHAAFLVDDCNYLTHLYLLSVFLYGLFHVKHQCVISLAEASSGVTTTL